MAEPINAKPKEYVAFENLLRKIVKPEPKPASAPAASEKH